MCLAQDKTESFLVDMCRELTPRKFLDPRHHISRDGLSEIIGKLIDQ